MEPRLWRGIDAWEELSSEWNNCSFGTVDVDTITKKVAEYNKVGKLEKLRRSSRLELFSTVFHGFSIDFSIDFESAWRWRCNP